MSEEASQVQSIQARIAALNLGQVGRAPITPTSSSLRAPSKPSYDQRRNSANIPVVQDRQLVLTNGIGNEPNAPQRGGVLPPPAITRASNSNSPSTKLIAPPRLPPRRPSAQPSPALPPRRPSDQISRRGSNESISSAISTISTISALSTGTARTPCSRTSSVDAGRVLFPVYDPSTLPPLPPKRLQPDKKAARIPLKSAKSTPIVVTTELITPPSTPPLPPRLPLRKPSSNTIRNLPQDEAPPMPARSALSFGMNKANASNTINGALNTRTPSPITNGTNQAPPPVPLASRPEYSKNQATEFTKTSSASPCLKCRDFSFPDAHAAKFPRQCVPSLDWLATHLTAPFPSRTDKARTIFTWLHHNISYDVVAFFNNAVQPSTPASTLSTGLAVCEGYAGLFTALASKAGLESLVVGGHGKGFSFAFLPPNAPIPSEYSTHAWNAVKIDADEWKLIDCCWGAGNVSGKGQPYNKAFCPRHFTMDNNEFGLRHFPSNKSHFFRTHGRARIPWEEYIVGDRGGELLRIYSGAAEKEGISETAFHPKYLNLPLSDRSPLARFQFSKVCPHWHPVRNGQGKPYEFVLAVHGPDGKDDDFVLFETDGNIWWVDVERRVLGTRGQTVSVFAVTTVGDASGRGLGGDGYRRANGRQGMGFQGIAAWVLV